MDIRYGYKILVGDTCRKTQPARRVVSEDNVKMNHTVIGREGVRA
jgi:hypothetical protein